MTNVESCYVRMVKCAINISKRLLNRKESNNRVFRNVNFRGGVVFGEKISLSCLR